MGLPGHRRCFAARQTNCEGGPAPAPLLRAETFSRYQLMLRTRQMSKLSQSLMKLTETLVLPEDVTLTVDVDPVNLA